MKVRLLKNILLVTLFTLVLIHLATPQNSANTYNSVTGAARVSSASKVAGSLTDAASKSQKFARILNTGLSTFSTYVYGVTAAMALIDLIAPGIIPQSEPAYVAEMRRNFAILKEEFRVVKNQINDLKLYVQKRSTEQIYSNYIISIHTMETFYEEYVDASSSLKAGFAQSYINNYDQQGNHADKLYTGLTVGDPNLNIPQNAISYTKGNRAQVLELMFELFNIITMGIKHEALYYKLKDDILQIQVLESRWETRMKNLQKVMRDVDNKLVRDSRNQIERDLDVEAGNLKDGDNSKMATNLYNWFSAKYYWQDWMVLIYSKSVKGWNNHGFTYCYSNTAVRKHLGGGVDKTIFMVHVDKASGSYYTKSWALSSLKTGSYEKDSRCRVRYGRSYRYEPCKVAETDLSKTLNSLKPPLKVCSVTKGILILKKGKSYGIKGDSRMYIHYSQKYFNAFAAGPYGPSSKQESVDNLSIDGRWTSWSSWTTCTKTCGGGYRTRKRECWNPVPQDGGRSCSGSKTWTSSCNRQTCVIDKNKLIAEIKSIMKANQKMDHATFASHLRNELRTRHPEFRFCVSAYKPVSGYSKHAIIGYSYVSIFRTYGRNIVVGYTKRSNSVPSSSERNAIEKRVVAAIYKKAKDAKAARDLAWAALKKEKWRVAMVMVVRHGNGLRTRWTGGGIFFENYYASGSHKSSLVVMLGKA